MLHAIVDKISILRLFSGLSQQVISEQNGAMLLIATDGTSCVKHYTIDFVLIYMYSADPVTCII